MIETDLDKLCWNPHTCGCKLTYRKEDTALMPPKVTRYIKGQGEHFKGLPDWQQRVISLFVHPDDSLYVYQSRFQTVKQFLRRAMERVFHDYDEEPPPSGTRVRAEIVKPCPEHEGVDFVLQTQMAFNDRVCRCRWFELCIGDREKGERYGHRMIEVCFTHAEVPYSAIPELVYEAGRELAKTEKVRPVLDAELRDGVAVLIYRDETGAEHVLTMERTAEAVGERAAQ